MIGVKVVVPRMAFQYDVGYTNEAVVSLFGAIAPAWKTPKASVAGLDTDKLFATLKKIVEEFREKGSTEKVDKDLQALLAVTTATSWFTEKQVEELDEWLDEVASAAEEDWIKHFSEEDLRKVVMKCIKPSSVDEISIDADGKVINIEYKGGNVGTGKHDGNLHLSEDGLRLYDYRHEGKYLVNGDDMPSNIEDLEWCLKSENWDEGWDQGNEDGW